MYKICVWRAKMLENWRFLCNFASMNQTIEDYIRHDEKFRQALLKLGGGILKYWAEHIEDDFDIDLFNGYERQVVEAYLQANKRNRALRSLPDDKLKWDALSWYHHESGKELKFYTDLRPELNKLPKEVKEQVDRYFVDYLEDNYREYLRYAYPANIAPLDFYNKVIRTFGVGGLARDCMDYILKDHHHPEVWSKMKSVDVVMTEFYIEEYSAFLSEERCFKKLRQGVKEKLAGKNQTECRHEAVKMMNSVKGFARMLYSSSEIGITDCTGGYKVDKKWLRGQSEGLAVAFRRDGYLKNSFPEYVGILNDIGRIWAARLLKEHGIDMHELEKETGAILYPVTEPSQNPDGLDHGNYKYYVDKDIFDPLDDQCCIYDEQQAKELLEAVRKTTASNTPKELLTEEAQPYWVNLREKGFIVAGGYSLAKGVNPYDATHIADLFSEKLKIKNKWKVFESLWGLVHMAQKLGDTRKGTATVPHQKEIDEIFGVKLKKPVKL